MEPTGWFQRQWNDIKGNVKFYFLTLFGSAVVTGVVIVTRGLQAWQQAIIVTCFLLMFGWGAVATWGWKKSKPSRSEPAFEDHDVRITILEGAFAERPSSNTLHPNVYLMLKIRILVSKNTTLDSWKLVLKFGEQFLCTPDLNFDEGLAFQEIQEPGRSLAGQITVVDNRRLNQIYSCQTLPQNNEIEGWLVFRASDNTKLDEILGATSHLLAHDGAGKSHEGTRTPGTWRRRVQFVSSIQPTVPKGTATSTPTTPNLVCNGIIREVLFVGHDHHHADTLVLRNDVLTQKATAFGLVASAVYTLASGRTVRVDHMKWIEDDPKNPYAWSIEMGITGHLVLATYVQRDSGWTFCATGYKTGINAAAPSQPMMTMYGLEMGSVTVDITLNGEHVRYNYRCEGILSATGAEWKGPEVLSMPVPKHNGKTEIISAEWGIGGTDYKDKKILLVGYLEASTTDLRASNTYFHDDYPGHDKHLVVRYRLAGSDIKTRTFAQNERITFS